MYFACGSLAIKIFDFFLQHKAPFAHSYKITYEFRYTAPTK
jgi:hypothetical protein